MDLDVVESTGGYFGQNSNTTGEIHLSRHVIFIRVIFFS